MKGQLIRSDVVDCDYLMADESRFRFFRVVMFEIEHADSTNPTGLTPAPREWDFSAEDLARGKKIEVTLKKGGPKGA